MTSSPASAKSGRAPFSRARGRSTPPSRGSTGKRGVTRRSLSTVLTPLAASARSLAPFVGVGGGLTAIAILAGSAAKAFSNINQVMNTTLALGAQFNLVFKLRTSAEYFRRYGLGDPMTPPSVVGARRAEILKGIRDQDALNRPLPTAFSNIVLDASKGFLDAATAMGIDPKNPPRKERPDGGITKQELHIDKVTVEINTRTDASPEGIAKVVVRELRRLSTLPTRARRATNLTPGTSRAP